MKIPDMTERFPEGMNGVDMTDRLMGGGVPDYDEYYVDDADMIEEMRQEDIGEYMGQYGVDHVTAEQIMEVVLNSELDIERLRDKRSRDIDKVLVARGYASLESDLPF